MMMRFFLLKILLLLALVFCGTAIYAWSQGWYWSLLGWLLLTLLILALSLAMVERESPRGRE